MDGQTDRPEEANGRFS